MKNFARPIVVVSRCLGFARCRWNGETVADPFTEALKPFVEYEPVCAEMEIGLGSPRPPVRLIDSQAGIRLVQPETGRDVTSEMNSFSREFFGAKDARSVDGLLLKGRSPSCGPVDVRVYSSAAKGAGSRKGRGIFAAAAMAALPYAAVEHEGRVRNFQIREHFLTKLFTLAQFRQVKKKGSMSGLVAFHSANKLLLMAYNQSEMRSMGRIVANQEKKPAGTVLAEYEVRLSKALARTATIPANINVLMHGLGHFKKGLKASEKAYFLDALETYRAKKTTLGTLQALLKSWAVRFDNEYVLSQTFFSPYPEALIDLADSGRGREV